MTQLCNDSCQTQLHDGELTRICGETSLFPVLPLAHCFFLLLLTFSPFPASVSPSHPQTSLDLIPQLITLGDFNADAVTSLQALDLVTSMAALGYSKIVSGPKQAT